MAHSCAQKANIGPNALCFKLYIVKTCYAVATTSILHAKISLSRTKMNENESKFKQKRTGKEINKNQQLNNNVRRYVYQFRFGLLILIK